MRILLFLLLLISMPLFAQDQPETPEYLDSYDRSVLDTINARINDSLTRDIGYYSAAQYTMVQFDSVSTRYWMQIPPKGQDSRDPQKYLTDGEKSMLVTKGYMIKQRMLSEQK